MILDIYIRWETFLTPYLEFFSILDKEKSNCLVDFSVGFKNREHFDLTLGVFTWYRYDFHTGVTCDFTTRLHVWLHTGMTWRFHTGNEYFAAIFDWLTKTTHAPPVPVYQETVSYRNEWPIRVYMIPVRVFVPERESRPGTATGMNSFRYESYRYEILDRYHVNEYRATRGKRDELIPVWKSYRYHVNAPSDKGSKTAKSQGQLRLPLAVF